MKRLKESNMRENEEECRVFKEDYNITKNEEAFRARPWPLPASLAFSAARIIPRKAS